ncbi:condensation domain-containing protein [Actinomadura welshii]
MTMVDGSGSKTATGPSFGSPTWRAFARQARATPDAVAVVDAGTALTYAELERRAARLWARLPRPGLAGEGGGEPLTAICLPRSADLVVAMLAALRGGGMVPLESGAPVGHRRSVLGDARPDALIGAADPAVPGGVAVVAPPGEEFGDAAGDAPGDGSRPDPAVPHREPHPRQIAYVIYTSGSTGEPKGVAVEHGALLDHLRAFGARFGIGPGDRYLLFASPATDVSVEQTLVPLLHGATLVLRRPGPAEAAARFWDFVRDERLSVVNVPAGYWRLLTLDAGGPDRCPALRWVIAGSDVLPADLAAAWAARSTGEAAGGLVNAYGPTEAVITASTRAVAAGFDPSVHSSVPLGVPLPDRELRVLDEAMRPVGEGDVGEIWLSGPCARGYLRDPGRTASVFLPDPWRPGERIYRTGDLARLLPGGQAEFTGRADRQVKVGGFRVEPATVEAACRLRPGVADCAAAPVRNDGETHLALLVVAAADGFDPAGLRSGLERALPAHLLPRDIHVVDELPLTDGGKVDYAAVEEAVARPPGDAEAAAAAPGEPATELERGLLVLWQEAFARQDIGLDDEFIALGGDSMTSLAIACRAPALGWQLRPRDVFEAGTVRGLAKALEAGGGKAERSRAEGGATDTDTDTDTGTGAGAQPVTPATLWLLDRLGHVPARWCQYVAVDLDDRIDHAVLGTALDEVVRRHPILASSLTRRDGEWVHLPQPEPPPVLGPAEYVAATGDWDESDEAEAFAAVRERLLGEIDPQAGRMLRAACAEHPGGRRLLLVAHHTVVDAVSWVLLLRELESVCGMLAEGWGLPAADPAPGAGDWAREAAEAVRAGDLDGELPRWTAVVADANAAGLAADAGTERDARTVSLELPAAAPPATGEAARAERLLAAVLAAWRRHSGRDRCVIEMESTGRDTVQAAGAYSAVGWLTALYPVVVDVTGEPGDLMARLRAATGDVPGDGAGYGLLRHHHTGTGTADALRLNGLPDLAFNFLGPIESERGGGLLAAGSAVDAGPLRGGDVPRPCPLVVEAWASGATLTVSLEFDGRRVDAAAAERFAADVRAALGELAEPPGGTGRDEAPQEIALTPAQEGILFHTLADGDPDSYIGQVAVEVTGPLSAERFTAAWQAACRATPALRTSFAWRRQAAPTQRIAPDGEVPVAVHDWSGDRCPPDPAEALLRTERSRGFDPECAPLLRVALARTGPDHHLCVVTHHHLILDGWSMNLLIGDVLEAYTGLAANPALRLPERPSAHRVLAARTAAGVDEDFWRRSLLGAAPSPLVPAGRERSGDHRETDTRLPAGEWTRIKDAARPAGLTPAALVHLAWAATLAWWTGHRDVTFGTVLSGRDATVPGIDQVSGMLINSLPVRLRLDGGRPLREWCADAADLLLGVQEHQHDSLVRVRAAAGRGPREPLFDHVLDFGSATTMLSAEEPVHAAGLRTRPLASVERTNYGVTVTAYAGDRLELSVNHDEGLLAADEARTLLDRLLAALAAFAGALGPPPGGGRLPAWIRGEEA